MYTEEQVQDGSKKKFFIIALISILLVAGILGYRYYYSGGIMIPGSGAPKAGELSESEKLLKAQVEAMDKLRAEYQSLNAPQATTTLAQQIKDMDALRAKQKTTSTAPKQTLEQQIAEMDALRAATLNK